MDDHRQPRIVYLVEGATGHAHHATPHVVAETGHLSAQMYETGNVSAQKSVRPGHPGHADILSRGAVVPSYDPARVHREFPERWRAYIRANFRNLGHVQQVFGVSERAARKWWNGEGGVNGAYTAIAMSEHPVQAHRMLFAAE